jgi:hypothetical protein
MAYTEKIIDITTGEQTIRPYTKAEVAEVEAALAQIESERLILENEKATKAQAKAALLERLGITADEAALLLS